MEFFPKTNMFYPLIPKRQRLLLSILLLSITLHVIFREILHASFSCNYRFEIYRFALWQTNYNLEKCQKLSLKIWKTLEFG